MNTKSHKVIFSKKHKALVVVSENVSNNAGAGKSGRSISAGFTGAVKFTASRFVGTLSAFATAAITLTAHAAPAVSAAPFVNALPKGGTVVQGKATITQNGNNLTINQTTNNAVVNWNSFDIGANAKVVINQPSANSAELERVTGNNASQIFGQLQSNGQVILVNSNGIVFGRDGSVSATGFTASTLGISDADFMSGNYQFKGAGSGAITNDGTIISTNNNGYVALLGAQVTNNGKIEAQHGGAAILAAAQDITVPVTSTGRIKLALSPSALNASVTNSASGVIVANDGQVYMQASGLNDAAHQSYSTVTQSGLIDVSGTKGGAVALLADGGAINVNGTINASGTNALASGDIVIGRDVTTGKLAATTDVSGATLIAKGGTVETSGDYLKSTGLKIEAKSWLLDPTNVEINATSTADTAGDSVVLADDISTALSAGTSVTITTAPSATGVSQVVVGSNITAAGTITLSAPITMSGSGSPTLTLTAYGAITINTNSAITATSGSLNVVMGVGQGTPYATANVNSNIITNGGNITITGSQSQMNFTGASGAPLYLSTGNPTTPNIPGAGYIAIAGSGGTIGANGVITNTSPGANSGGLVFTDANLQASYINLNAGANTTNAVGLTGTTVNASKDVTIYTLSAYQNGLNMSTSSAAYGSMVSSITANGNINLTSKLTTPYANAMVLNTVTDTSTTGGTINITATATTATSYGLFIQSPISATSGLITINASTPSGTGSYNSLVGSATGTISAPAGLAVNVNGGTGYLNGVISGTTLSVNQTSGYTGVLALNAANTYTGLNTVYNGTLQAGNSTSAVTTPFGTNTGPISVSAGANVAFAFNNNFTYGNVIQGAGNVIETGGSGAGLTSLTAINTYTGTTTVQAGTLQMGNLQAFGSTSGITVGSTSTSAATLDFNGYSIANPISINGTGVSSLGALVNNSSTTAVNESGLITVSSNANIGGNGSKSLTFSGGIASTLTSGNPSNTLSKVGTDTVILTNTTNYNVASTNVTGGTLQIGANNTLGTTTATLGSNPVVLSNGANVLFTSGSATTISNAISGAGNVSANITGTLIVGTATNGITLTGTASNTPSINLTASGSITQSGILSIANASSTNANINLTTTTSGSAITTAAITGTTTGTGLVNVAIEANGGVITVPSAITANNVSIDNTNGSINATTGAITAGVASANSASTAGVIVSGSISATGNLNIAGANSGSLVGVNVTAPVSANTITVNGSIPTNIVAATQWSTPTTTSNGVFVSTNAGTSGTLIGYVQPSALSGTTLLYNPLASGVLAGSAVTGSFAFQHVAQVAPNTFIYGTPADNFYKVVEIVYTVVGNQVYAQKIGGFYTNLGGPTSNAALLTAWNASQFSSYGSNYGMSTIIPNGTVLGAPVQISGNMTINSSASFNATNPNAISINGKVNSTNSNLGNLGVVVAGNVADNASGGNINLVSNGAIYHIGNVALAADNAGISQNVNYNTTTGSNLSGVTTTGSLTYANSTTPATNPVNYSILTAGAAISTSGAIAVSGTATLDDVTNLGSNTATTAIGVNVAGNITSAGVMTLNGVSSSASSPGVNVTSALSSASNINITGNTATTGANGINLASSATVTSTGTATTIAITSNDNITNAASLAITGATGTGGNINLTSTSGAILGVGAIGTITNNNVNVTFAQGVGSNYDGAINAANFTKNGAGALILDSWAYTPAAATNESGAYTVNASTLTLNSGTSYNNISPANVYINNASTFSTGIGNGIYSGTTFTFDSNGGGTLNFSGNPVTSLSGTPVSSNTIITNGGVTDKVTGTLNSNGQGLNLNVAAATSGTSVPSSLSNSFAGLMFTSPVVASQGIQNGGAVTKSGAGTLLFNDTATINTALNINAGTVQVGNNAATGSLNMAAGSTMVNSGALLFDTTAATTMAGAISGTGTLTQYNVGTTTLTGANTYTGTTTIGGGVSPNLYTTTLQIGASATTGTTGSLGTGPTVLKNGSTLSFQLDNNVNVGGNISGVGNVVANITGTWTDPNTIALTGTSSIPPTISLTATGAISQTGAMTLTNASSTNTNVAINATATGSGVTVGAITGTSTGTGSVNVYVESNGGNVVAGGAISANNVSLDNTNGTINTTTGAITQGTAAPTSTSVAGMALNKNITALGNINFAGVSSGFTGTTVAGVLTSANIQGYGGAIISNANPGLYFGAGSAVITTAGSGSNVLTGADTASNAGGSSALLINGSMALTAATGSTLTLNGQASSVAADSYNNTRGTRIGTTATVTTNGAIAINGSSSSNDGFLQFGTVNVQTGSLAITGTNTSVGGGSQWGVNVQGPINLSNGTSIAITGSTANPTATAYEGGVFIGVAGTIQPATGATSAGNISITGSSSSGSNSVGVYITNAINTNTGNITILGQNLASSSGTTVNIAGNVGSTSGNVTLQTIGGSIYQGNGTISGANVTIDNTGAGQTSLIADTTQGLSLAVGTPMGGSINATTGEITPGSGVDYTNFGVGVVGGVNYSGNLNIQGNVAPSEINLSANPGVKLISSDSLNESGTNSIANIKSNGIISDSGVINDAVGGLTVNISGGGGVVLNNNITASGAGGINITAGTNASSTAAFTIGSGVTTTPTLTQSSGSGGINIITTGSGNLTVPKIIDNGTGNVVIAAGSGLAVGNTSGNVLTNSADSISLAAGNNLTIYSGSATNTGNLSNLNGGLSNLYLAGSGYTPNAQLSTAYGSGGNTISGGSNTQVLFRDATTPTFNLTLNSLTKTYGAVDPSLTTASLLDAYSGSSTLTYTPTGGNNTFTMSATTAINNLTGLTGATRTAGENVNGGAPYYYSGVSGTAENVNLTAQPSLVINPANLTISANVILGGYDGVSSYQTLANNAGFTTSGLLNTTVNGVVINDSVSAVVSQFASGSVVGSGTSLTGTGVAQAGSFNQTISGASGVGVANYNITYVGNTGSIAKANLSASGSQVYNATTAFNGASLTTITGVGGETFTATGAGVLSSANVQTNQNLNDLGTLNLSGNNGASLSNYNPLTVAQTTVSVTPATAKIVANKVYDSNTSLSSNQITITGVSVNGVAETLNYSGTPLLNNANVSANSSNFVLGLTALTNGSGLASNYVLPSQLVTSTNNVATVSANSTPINIVSNSSSTIYSGVAQTLSGYVATGLIGTDANTPTAVAGISASVTATNAGSYSNAFSGSNSNYSNITFVPGTLTIDAATAKVSATKVYNSNTSLSTSQVTIAGVNGENLYRRCGCKQCECICEQQ